MAMWFFFDLTKFIGLGASSSRRKIFFYWNEERSSNPAICIPQSQVITGFPMAPTSPLSSTLNSGISNSIAQKQHHGWWWWLLLLWRSRRHLRHFNILAEEESSSSSGKTKPQTLWGMLVSQMIYHQQSSILHLNLITLIN